MNKKTLSWQHIKLLSSDVHFSNVLLQSKMKLANYSLDSYNNCYEPEADLGFFRSRGHNGATIYREGPSLPFKSLETLTITA